MRCRLPKGPFGTLAGVLSGSLDHHANYYQPPRQLPPSRRVPVLRKTSAIRIFSLKIEFHAKPAFYPLDFFL